MIDPTSPNLRSAVDPSPAPRPGPASVARVLLAMACAVASSGCDREKPQAEPAPKLETKAADASTPSPSSPEAADQTAPETRTFQRVWLKWDGSAWTYYAPTTASGSEPTDPNDPPPPGATWSRPQDGTVTLSADRDTIVRALVHNTTGKDIQATFENEGALPPAHSKTVAFSSRFASYDDWDFSIPPGDPVFHIKKGSTSNGTVCGNATLTYGPDPRDADSWTYTPAGGEPRPVGEAMTCVYEDSTEFDITLTNGSTQSKTFQIAQTRAVGLSPKTVPWNDTAWEIGLDTHLATRWTVFVVGHEDTRLALALMPSSAG